MKDLFDNLEEPTTTVPIGKTLEQCLRDTTGAERQVYAQMYAPFCNHRWVVLKLDGVERLVCQSVCGYVHPWPPRKETL